MSPLNITQPKSVFVVNAMPWLLWLVMSNISNLWDSYQPPQGEVLEWKGLLAQKKGAR